MGRLVVKDRLLIVPDVHAPYQHKQAFAVLCEVAKGWAPTHVVCLGDFADMYCVSSHPKDPRVKLPLEQEVAGVNEALDQLDKAVGRRAKKHFLQGNHETRLSRFLVEKAPELIGCVDWADLFKLDKRRWQVTPYKKSITIGDLRLTHDVGRAGVNAARQSMIDLGDNIAFGHTHRLQVHYQGQLYGKPHVGATMGWLGDPEAIDYRHQDSVSRDSIHGFGVAHILTNGHFWLQAIPIVQGRAVVDGVLYTA